MNSEEMVKVRKSLARKMFYNGITITLIPCKCRLDNHFFRCDIDFECGDDITIQGKFDRLVNEFEYYNCCNELGKYTHFYVSVRDYDSYEMCQKMCGGMER